MKNITIFLLCLLIVTSPSMPTEKKELKYNLTYRFQMDMKGRILLFIPYRSFYEASASVNFIARKTNNNPYEFYYDGINQTGYVMTTGGLTGTSLYFFTADYDMEKSTKFRENKITAFMKTYPSYKKSIKKIRRRPMTILSHNKDAIQFTRNANGVHSNSVVNMKLTDSRSFTYSNIYKIMGKLLKIYNHSFLPEHGLEGLKKNSHRTWYSKTLDFSRIMTEAARLSSEWAEKNARFKQKRNLILQYQVASVDDHYIVIRGESHPNVRVWKKMGIKHVLRQIRIRLQDNVVVEDTFYLNFFDRKGKGGFVQLKLKITNN
ncbi:MAG: hypothetical protein GTO45_32755 [Candidatus Aminicenantes bacterium]|nr:hypothetical protein [Candidatus Aminicenantes bacterium]NIM83522.1 hypothetical protein [Candidatus Aminicenantes bacterium]NIN46650.1 hypothetical protein [Candidatus Aminicenantes bacterium]NIN89553.1 hypothetical protein [Candidatus Aminicenantes bacterium]NIO86099.1 hypothetical protein [Candidatus Aminicenantes bacterium]